MITKRYRVSEYLLPDGANPYRLWLEAMPELIQGRIQARLFRFDRESVIVLLVGGEKRTQRADISRAKRFWLDYKSRGSYGKEKR